MKKVIINSLKIFDIKTYIDRNVNGEKLIKSKKISHDDFHINEFVHFPVLVKDDGSLWKYGCLYLLSKLKSYIRPATSTLDAIASDLKLFYLFVENQKIDYLKAPRKILSPTYMYREYLEDQLRDQRISPNTLKRRMGTVINFYKYLINDQGIKFKYPLWESGLATVSYGNKYGSIQYKEVETKDLLKTNKSSTTDSTEECIIDGGRLHPLEKNKQIVLLKALKNINNTEMSLAFLIALTTGARMQSVFTLRKKHFNKIVSENDEEVRINIGYGTLCDTKRDKNYTLIMPAWLYTKIKIYLSSPRFVKRAKKSKHIFDDSDHQYVFLNNRGKPYYIAKEDPYRSLYGIPPSGSAIRQFIHGSLKQEMSQLGEELDFSFHDLRATFGMNLYDSKINLRDTGNESIDDILLDIKDRMGHSSLQTTMQYLNYRKRNKKKYIQTDYEEYMMGILDWAS